MSEYKIDKNIPIPTCNLKNRGNYPFESLEIGDSFLIPNKDLSEEEFKSKCQSVYRVGRIVADVHNKLFKSKRVNEGRRVWRVK